MHRAYLHAALVAKVLTVQCSPVMLNTAGDAGEAGEGGDIFSRPSYDSPSAGGDTTRSGLRLRPITGHR